MINVALYVETNFLVGVALGREAGAEKLFGEISPGLSIFLPEVCIMEAYTFLAGERKRRNEFGATLAHQRGELSRFQNSTSAQTLAGYLERAIAENTDVMTGVEERLRWVLERIPGVATEHDVRYQQTIALLNVRAHSLWSAHNVPLIADPADNLILHVILNHARMIRGSSTEDSAQVLLTSNVSDFGAQPVRSILNEAGVSRLFSNVQDFLGWFNAVLRGTS